MVKNYTYEGAKRCEFHFGDTDNNLVRFRLNNDKSVSRVPISIPNSIIAKTVRGLPIIKKKCECYGDGDSGFIFYDLLKKNDLDELNRQNQPIYGFFNKDCAIKRRYRKAGYSDFSSRRFFIRR